MAEYDRPDLMLRVRVGVEFQSSADEIGEMKQFKFSQIITQIFKGGILDPPGDLKLRQQILPGDIPVLLPIENMVGNLKITEEEKQGKVKIMICGQIQTILMIDLL